MKDDIQIEIFANVLIKLGNKEVIFFLVPKRKSHITNKILNEEDIPEEFSEIIGFERIDESSDMATFKEVLVVSHAIVPQMFLISLNKPLLFKCDRRLAMFSEKVYKNKFNVRILRGSLREDSPYEDTYENEDVHIVMLSNKKFT